MFGVRKRFSCFSSANKSGMGRFRTMQEYAYGALKFEGQPLGITSTQKVFTRAKARAGIDKDGYRRSGL